MAEPIEPTPDEIRNGWDKASLGRYLAERKAAQSDIINLDPKARPKPKPRVASRGYRPLRRRS